MTPPYAAAIKLDRETTEAIAEQAAKRTVELLRQADHGGLRPQLVDAAALAAALGVSRDCVYAHASELGGKRIGNGPRGRLRFDLDWALEAWTSRSDSKTSPEPDPSPVARDSARQHRKRMGSDANLLPIRGQRHSANVAQERS